MNAVTCSPAADGTLGRRDDDRKPPWEPAAELTAAPLRVAALVPDEGRGAGAAFRPRTAVTGDAPPGDRLLALLGRDPSWTPAPC